jgi:hypothetical protein
MPIAPPIAPSRKKTFELPHGVGHLAPFAIVKPAVVSDQFKVADEL